MLSTLHPGRIGIGAFFAIVVVAASAIMSLIGKHVQAEPQDPEPIPQVPVSVDDKKVSNDADPVAAKPQDAANAVDDKKNAVLTVIVTGNGTPIAGAEVKIKFPSSIGGEETRYTDKQGHVTFRSSATGPAWVRVIADGWEAVLKNVDLKKGPQNLTASVNPIQPPD